MEKYSHKDVVSIITSILNIDQKLNGEEYLKQFIKNIATQLNVKYAFIGHPSDKSITKVQTDVVWANGDFHDNFVYDLKDTPCELVLSGQRVCIHDKNVCATFPDDYLLQEMGVEAYVGAPVIIKDAKGVSSIFVLLDDKPMEDVEFFSTITEFLALRASAEIEKLHIEEKLRSEVEIRTHQLKEANEKILSLNKNLEKRVKEEVKKNLKQQDIIADQFKMATMGEMINNIAHQWKQPLSSILTVASALEIEKEFGKFTDESFDEGITSIKKSVRYLSDTINDFREYFSKNKVKKEFELQELMEKTFSLLTPLMKKSEIEVIKNVESISYLGFENELLQVIMNIISNARDQLQNIEEDKLLFIDVYKDDKNLYIDVLDNAGGIKDSIIDSIFDPYVTSKEEGKGTGIGLYMSQMIINNMNGEIKASNVTFTHDHKNYTGAKFRVTLPIV